MEGGALLDALLDKEPELFEAVETALGEVLGALLEIAPDEVDPGLVDILLETADDE